ncbi:uncharacterized protein MKK02DRAFT_29162 [Dioszegia hungarica]|uniref:Uncharacterized protein n=1 Tax=Dioszegia hungarica TaxID=4972 RepID=A0AA38H6C9_9TREE|nr:uncharacterized protein MKK02DRAFT_29162 [Dioszegia hungarica]KAI9633304.1 hypothetical protein MKK02DRAFT_29162 [Dioszegia hungarica]
MGPIDTLSPTDTQNRNGEEIIQYFADAFTNATSHDLDIGTARDIVDDSQATMPLADAGFGHASWWLDASPAPYDSLNGAATTPSWTDGAEPYPEGPYWGTAHPNQDTIDGYAPLDDYAFFVGPTSAQLFPGYILSSSPVPGIGSCHVLQQHDSQDSDTPTRTLTPLSTSRPALPFLSPTLWPAIPLSAPQSPNASASQSNLELYTQVAKQSGEICSEDVLREAVMTTEIPHCVRLPDLEIHRCASASRSPTPLQQASQPSDTEDSPASFRITMGTDPERDFSPASCTSESARKGYPTSGRSPHILWLPARSKPRHGYFARGENRHRQSDKQKRSKQAADNQKLKTAKDCMRAFYEQLGPLSDSGRLILRPYSEDEERTNPYRAHEGVTASLVEVERDNSTHQQHATSFQSLECMPRKDDARKQAWEFCTNLSTQLGSGCAFVSCDSRGHLKIDIEEHLGKSSSN